MQGASGGALGGAQAIYTDGGASSAQLQRQVTQSASWPRVSPISDREGLTRSDSISVAGGGGGGAAAGPCSLAPFCAAPHSACGHIPRVSSMPASLAASATARASTSLELSPPQRAQLAPPALTPPPPPLPASPQASVQPLQATAEAAASMAAPAVVVPSAGGAVPVLHEPRALWLTAPPNHRWLLLEDEETGDVLMPLIYLKPVLDNNYSRKVGALAHRAVALPPGSLAGGGEGGGSYYWAGAFEAPHAVKRLIRRHLGDAATPQGHLYLVLLPLVYNALASKPALADAPLLRALAAPLARSAYAPLLQQHGLTTVEDALAQTAGAAAAACTAPLFTGPRSLAATARKYLVSLQAAASSASAKRAREDAPAVLVAVPEQPQPGPRAGAQVGEPARAASTERERIRRCEAEVQQLRLQYSAQANEMAARVQSVSRELATVKGCLVQLYDALLLRSPSAPHAAPPPASHVPPPPPPPPPQQRISPGGAGSWAPSGALGGSHASPIHLRLSRSQGSLQRLDAAAAASHNYAHQPPPRVAYDCAVPPHVAGYALHGTASMGFDSAQAADHYAQVPLMQPVATPHIEDAVGLHHLPPPPAMPQACAPFHPQAARLQGRAGGALARSAAHTPALRLPAQASHLMSLQAAGSWTAGYGAAPEDQFRLEDSML